MATRKPKIAPSKNSQKEQKTSSSEEIELKDQGRKFKRDVLLFNSTVVLVSINSILNFIGTILLVIFSYVVCAMQACNNLLLLRV